MNRHTERQIEILMQAAILEVVPQTADSNISHFDPRKNAKASKTLLLITSRNKNRSSHPTAQHEHHLF
ncbi:hypothetical protein T4B_10183 [Trichinella pseudospiralis]|uniref:Uncharacterized protein n=1 Tax=Trichinella pseudospiralis TaxID=6337 RepID=A0A0V1IGZ2_TRIPS|nr:hypothetical protein T4B_10183 [Trichinella pseudospiralis]